MAIIAAPPREKNPYGSGIEKLIEMYLMQSIGALFELPQKEADTKLDLLKEFGGEFTPEQAGLLEKQLTPKTGIAGIIESFKKPVSTGYTTVPGAKPKLDVLPAQPGEIEAVVDPNAQTLIPNIPTVKQRPSILQAILQPTERGTYRMPSREERLTKGFGERAKIETGEYGAREKLAEAAKEPGREKERMSKAQRLEDTLAVKENQITMMRDWHDQIYRNQQSRIDEAMRHNMASEEILRMKNELLEMKTSFSKAEAAWKEDVARIKADAYKQQVEKIGQASEKDNIKAFENEAISQGWLKVDPKSKAKTWRELDDREMATLENIASQYGFSISKRGERTTWGGYGRNVAVPFVNYKTERSEKKIEKAGKATTPSQPKEKMSEENLKKDLIENGYTEAEANDYIERAKKAGKL